MATGARVSPHIVPLEPFDRRVNIVHLDDLDVSSDAVLPGEVQHGLAVADAAHAVPGDALPARDDGVRRQLQRLARRPAHHHLPHGPQQLQQRHDRVPRRHRVDDAVHGARRGLHLLRVAADQEVVGAQAVQRLLALPQRRADHGDFHPERLAELDGHVAEPAEAHDAEVLPGRVEAVLHHGAVHRDAGAEQRRGAVRGQRVRDAHDVVLVDDDHVGEPALRGRAVVVHAVGGEHQRGAVVLVPFAAAVAGAARVEKVAHAHRLARLEVLHAGADVGHDADDLMPGNDGVQGVAPLVLDDVEVRVADPTEEHLDRHIVVLLNSS